MKTFQLSLLTHLSLTAALAAQQSTLLFTPKLDEETRSGSNGTVLRNLANNAIGFVTPSAALAASAEKFAPSLAFQTLAGDEDADGDVHSPGLFGTIDAIAVLPYDWDAELGARPRQRPVTMLDCYVSPSTDVGTNVSGAPGLRRGDCGRIVRTPAGNGQVTWFIRAEQLISAFGMFDPATMMPLTPNDIDLDAITVAGNRDIFVSFDGNHSMRLFINGALANFAVADGAVVAIPAAAWVPNARGEVANVLANRGVIVMQEPQANALVVNAALTDNAGACVPAMVDTEGLAIDPVGGVFNSQWGNQQVTWPHLLLTGELMSGAGVITTRNAGQIAQVNGGALARACGTGPTNGVQLGIAPSGSVSPLIALESLRQEPCWFVLGSPTPHGLGGPVEVHIGTNLPTAFAFLGLGLGVLPVSPSIAAPAFLNNGCFPELYPAILPNPLIAIALAAGMGNARFGALSVGASPVVAPGILFQAVTMAGGALHLSSPVTLH
jgi:hypothetical protein